MQKTSERLHFFIKKLTQSEKRHFSKYCKQYSSSKDLSYLKLYKDYDKAEKYDDKFYTKKYGKTKFSSLSKHLYEQILASLRNLYIDKYDTFEVLKNNIDIKILTKKKMYVEAEAIIDKNIELSHEKYLHFLKTDLIELKFQYLKLINKNIDYKQSSNYLLEESNKSLELSRKKIKLSYYIGNFINIHEKELDNILQNDINIIDSFLQDPLFKERDFKMSLTSEKDRLTNYVVAHSIKRNYKIALKYSIKLYDIFHDKYKNKKNKYLYLNNIIISSSEANDEIIYKKFLDIFINVKNIFPLNSMEYNDISLRILILKNAHYALNKEYISNYVEYTKTIDEFENLNSILKAHSLYSQFMISKYLIEFKAGNYNNSLEMIQEYYLFTKNKNIYHRNKYEGLYKTICLIENKDFDVASDILRMYKRKTSGNNDILQDVICKKIGYIISNKKSNKINEKIKTYKISKLNVYEKLLILWALKHV